jgi:predicted AlkP superfamily pyrophosphatase or phosphodiesterase
LDQRDRADLSKERQGGRHLQQDQEPSHTTCWKKEDIPARLHYNEGRRVAPIVCSSEEGWITSNHKRYDDWYKDIEERERPRGAHGYDNKYQSMMATFLAHGEAFKRGYVAEPFENIEVYNLMCEILGLKPAKNDGDLKRVRGCCGRSER